MTTVRASIAILAAIVFGMPAALAATDVTSSLEYLFTPLGERYTGTGDSALHARGVHCLRYLDGRIFVGGGEWNDNTGPVPVYSITPGATPSLAHEYTPGSEAIEDFKKFSDGRVWTRATDAREHDANYGFFFARDTDANWTKTANVDWNPFHTLIGGSGAWGIYTHVWDFCEYKNNLYFAGYGIGGSSRWLTDDPNFSQKMYSVTVNQTNLYYTYRSIVDYSFTTNKSGEVSTNVNFETKQTLNCFMALFPFENGCIAAMHQCYNTVAPELNTPTIWRLNESTGKFAEEETTWDTLFGGWRFPDYELKTSNNWCTLVHPFRVTPYKGRCFYTVVQSTAMSLPLGAFSATMDSSGKIASQRLVFENGYAHPIDFAVVGGNLYVMTVKRNTTSSIEHGIWKTHDGVSFEKLAVFTTDQYFESFTYAKGHFYLGYGCAPVGYGSFASSVATPATDKAGQIWRFSLPQADDDGSNDGLTPYVPTYDASAWYMGELGVTNLLNAGVTGKGVKVGMVDTGIRPIVNGSVTNMAIDVLGGDTSQTESHGLGVASIIKSDKFGIAPECTLYAYNGSGFVDDINGIWWCFTNGCRVVNFSGGYTPFDYTEQQLAWATTQIREMLAQGLILVAAGGNAPNETLSFPQDIDGVINIAGLKQDRTSAGLNDNWAKDFAAFGQNVPLYTSDTGATGTNGGSSFAAPMATAICALYLQQNPALTRDELYEILKTNCVKLSDGPSKVWGNGLLQAGAIPANYKTQAQIDAEKASYVKTTSATLSNKGLEWNSQYSRYEIKMYPGETRKLKYTLVPANASDTNLYWYCGNTVDFRPIGLDQALTAPSSTATGKFLVYDGRNRERETICRLRVDVVAKGSESEADTEDDPEGGGNEGGGGEGGEGFTPTNSWFTVDCVGGVFAPDTNYFPGVVGFCESNAYVEIQMTFHVTESEPTPDASDKSMIYLAANEDGTGRSFRLLDKSGWKDVSSVGLEPTDGLSRRVRIDLEEGSAESRRVRYSIDGKVLSANGVEWFEMTSGGDIREIVFFGDSEIAAFFGEFCESFGTVAPTLEELLGGKLPRIAGYTSGGKTVPALVLENGVLSASVAETVSGVYYTAFTSATLDRKTFTAKESLPGTGEPITFELEVGEASSQFLIVVASSAPIVVGAPLE